MKTPYLSIKQRFLLLVAAALLFGITSMIHAEGLSGLKKSINKGKISTEVPDEEGLKLLKPISAPKTKLRSQRVSDVFKKYDFYKMLENTKEVYIDKDNKLVKIKVNQKQIIIKVPVFSKPVQKKSKIALLRIGESPSKIPPFTSTNFEDEFPQTENTREIEAQKFITSLRATIENEFNESNFSKIIAATYQICSDYPDLPYICALAKLYHAEAYLKANQNKEAADIEHEMKQLCEQIIEEYKPLNSPLLKLLISKIEERINNTQKIIDEKKIKIEAKIKDYVKEVEALRKQFEEAKLKVYDYAFQFEYNYTLLYKKIADSLDYATSGVINNEDTQKLISQLQAVYNQPPFNIKTQVYVGNFPGGHYEIKEVTIDPKKARPGSYANAFGAATMNDGKFRKFNNDYMTYDDLKNKINDYGKLVSSIPPYSGDAWEELIARHPKIYRYYIYSDIKMLYFTLNETNEARPEEVYPVKTLFALRATFSDNSDNYKVKDAYYTFDITIKSKISDRHKILKMKPDLFYGECSAKFIPNETDDPGDKVKNLINNEKDAFKESVACFNGEDTNEQLLEFYKSAPYFSNDDKHNILGYSTGSRKSQFNEDHVIIKNSASFLKSGGTELIIAERNGKKAVALLEHTADWFIVDSHGWVLETSGGQGGIIEDSLEGQLVDYVHVNPEEIYKKSSYSKNMDVLILSACETLKWVGDDTDAIVFAMGWHRILPEGIILGYSETVSEKLIRDALADFTSKIPETGVLSTNEITIMWVDSNIKKFAEFINQQHPIYGRNGQKHYQKTVYIVGQDYYYIHNYQIKKRSLANRIASDIKVDNSNIKHYTFKR
ncbi:MAG TPA: hypothetical protein DDW90_05695 [Cyanobacteria bacterium UBA9971]|nr:hypothetical protein [Cyanobacteria bacterium UBA9971]